MSKLCLLVSLVAVSLSAVVVPAKKDAKSYEILVHTGTVFMAGTDAKVYMTIDGSDGNSEELQLQGEFESGDTDATTFHSPGDYGSLKQITVWHDGTGYAPGWFLEWIHIIDEAAQKEYDFPCSCWLAADEGGSSRTITVGNEFIEAHCFTGVS